MHKKSKFYYWKSLLGAFLWLLSLVALVFAWIASVRETGTFLGLPVAHLFWDALVLGVLSLGAKTGHKPCSQHMEMAKEEMKPEEMKPEEIKPEEMKQGEAQ